MRWLRLANLITASPVELLLEDANELAAWRSRPPAVVVQGHTIWLSPVPSLSEWLPRPEREAGSGSSPIKSVEDFLESGG